jgi:hypothetical protein
LAELDGFGHLTWCVGDDNWIACFDFIVTAHERGILVAYHVVVDCESAGFTDTVEAKVVEADKAPFDLPNYWVSLGYEQGVEHDDEADKINESWNTALKQAIKEAQESL